MKSLISANVVKAAHAAGQSRLPADPRSVIVTAEARSVALRLGIALDAAAQSAAPEEKVEPRPACAPCSASPAGGDAQAMDAVRQQILARIPPGSVTDEQLDRIITRTLALEGGASNPDAPIHSDSPSTATESLAAVNAYLESVKPSLQSAVAAPDSSSNLVGAALQWCRLQPRKVVFPDAVDERALNAASELVRLRAMRPVLVGDEHRLRAMALSAGIVLDHVEIVDPASYKQMDSYAELLHERLSAKGVDRVQARQMLLDPLYLGAMMVRAGDADSCVAGNLSSTANVLKSALRVIGPAQGIKTVSSIFFMIPPSDDGRVLGFADCSVVPEPTVGQLADIALSSAASFENATGEKAKVAMLSFSTRGSVQHPAVDLVGQAVKLVKSRAPGLTVEGELQFDAAFVPEIAARKAPSGELNGQANVFVFPTLAAGNIGYKIAERMGRYAALGPLIQGLGGAMHDLSRGCSAKDMVEVALLAMKMAYGGQGKQ
ncbi:MAG: phosphate acetyltransferase [Paucibacter sp.]|nr:phosphate acetyltransferase [Roseateles sp.]